MEKSDLNTTWQMPPLRQVLGVAGAWLVFIGVLVISPPKGMSPQALSTLAVVAWAVIIWVTEAIPVGITGLIIPMLLILTGALPKMPDAFAGFTSHTTYICLGAFMLAAFMKLAGLDRRIALTILEKFKVDKADKLISGMFLVNFLLALLIPATAARGATLLPVVKGLTKLFGNSTAERKARSAIVIQCMVYATMICGVVVMTAHMPNLIMVNLFEAELGYSVGYLQWFWLHAPMLLMLVPLYYWTQWYFKTKSVSVPGGVERIHIIKEELGPTTRVEWILLGLFCLTAVAWATSKGVFGIEPGIMTIVVLNVFFIPGLLPWKWKMIQENTAWGTFLFLAGAMSLSVAMSKTGLAKYLADLAEPMAFGHHWILVLLILMLVTHVIRIGMLSNVAAIAFLAPVMVSLAPVYNMNPIPFTLLICDIDTFAFLIPTQITVGVLAYSSGEFTMKDYALVGAGTMVMAMAFNVLIMVPWYALNGFPLMR